MMSQSLIVCYHYVLAQNPSAMAAIRAGMHEWTSKTCIRFRKRTNEAAYAYFQPGQG